MVIWNTAGGASNHSKNECGGLSKRVIQVDKISVVQERGCHV